MWSLTPNASWITITARVSRILPDDTQGLEHQRFIVACTGGQTLLVANDISIGQRVPLRDGERLVIHGQYVWNDQGGLIHFTHHDPAHTHEDGWIELKGVRYN